MQKSIPGIMTKFEISELSGVDDPAQPHARRTLFKRSDMTDRVTYDEVIKRNFSDSKRKELAASGKALPDGSFPIENEEDLHNAVHLYGHASNPAEAKAHIITRAKSMGATGALPADWVKKENTTMDLAELRKSLNLAPTATDADVIAALAKAKEESDKKAKDAEDEMGKALRAQTIAGFSSGEREYFDGLSAEAQTAFLGKSARDRSLEVSKAFAGDETIELHGQTIRKSKIGPEMFAVLKAEAEKTAALEKRLDAAETAAANSAFVKRATEEFGHLSGTIEQRAAMLKAVEAVTDPEAKKALEATLKAANTMAAYGFERFGKGGSKDGKDPMDGDEDDCEKKLQKAAVEIQKAAGGEKNLSFAKAYEKALEENPDLYEAQKAKQRARAAAVSSGSPVH